MESTNLALLQFDNIVELHFDREQSQDLFDQLPVHCAVQKLIIYSPQLDLRLLFKLKNAIRLGLQFTIGLELIPKIFEELSFLSFFHIPV